MGQKIPLHTISRTTSQQPTLCNCNSGLIGLQIVISLFFIIFLFPDKKGC